MSSSHELGCSPIVVTDSDFITNKEAESLLRGFLISRGYALRPHSDINGATGPDIVAKSQSGEICYIEVIGYKRNGSARSKDFCEGVFRAISRIKLGAYKAVLACPWSFQLGLSQRVKNLDVAWLRLGTAFPELELWFIFPDGTAVDRGSWNDWGNRELYPPQTVDCTKGYRDPFGPPVANAAFEYQVAYQKNVGIK